MNKRILAIIGAITVVASISAIVATIIYKVKKEQEFIDDLYEDEEYEDEDDDLFVE